LMCWKWSLYGRETKAPTPEAPYSLFNPKKRERVVEEIAEEMDIEGAVDGMNEIVEHVHRGLRFVLHEDTNRMMVRVIDVVTDEVIKEIPPEVFSIPRHASAK